MTTFKIIKQNSLLHPDNIGTDRFDLVRKTILTPDNKELSFGVITAPDGVIVLPVDENINVFLKKEWRLNREDYVWELPSGYCKTNNPTSDELIQTVQQEMESEVGKHAAELIKLTEFYPMNHTSFKFHIFLAKGLDDIKQKVDSNSLEEYIETKMLPFREAEELCLKKQIPTAQVLIAFNEGKKYLESTVI